MAGDFTGTSLNSAKTISTHKTIRGSLDKHNASDLFKINFAEASTLQLKYRASSRGASLRLIQDRNQNGKIDAEEMLKRISLRPKKERSLTVKNLSAGTYFIRLETNRRGTNTYRLSLATASVQAKPQPTGENSGPSFIQQVLNLTNRFRQQHGRLELKLSGRLSAIALQHSQDMAVQDYFSHTGKDGSQPWERMTAGGYAWSRAAENIAAGQRTPAEVVQAWINSPGHRANMLDPDVKEIGIGYYFFSPDTGTTNYQTYWTQLFGTPR